MRQRTYPGDISREQFKQILPILEQARKRTKPRSVDLYEVFCAVLYLLRTGCQWRALPSDFPKWPTVHAYFAKWSEVNAEG
ncbi:MAG: transposase, partial [Brachymonas sp.]|nr:transposase [Brachymonas sp.]